MKIAVITGSSSGMGRDFAIKIDKEYTLDEIWLIARREERLKELGKELKTKARILSYDLSSPSSIEEYKALLNETKPEVEILVNAAGFGVFGAFEKSGEKQSDIVVLNDKALVDVTYTTLPYLKSGSSIVNLGSNSSWQPVPYIAVYGASKAFVLSFSRALSMELSPEESESYVYAQVGSRQSSLIGLSMTTLSSTTTGSMKVRMWLREP